MNIVKLKLKTKRYMINNKNTKKQLKQIMINGKHVKNNLKIFNKKEINFQARGKILRITYNNKQEQQWRRKILYIENKLIDLFSNYNKPITKTTLIDFTV